MLNSKKWNKIRKEFKQLRKNSPKNESVIFFVNFKTKTLSEKVELTVPGDLLPFVKKKTKK